MGDDELKHPIVYIIKTLTPATKDYTVSKIECLVVIWSIESLRAYDEGYSITVITDYTSLR